MIIKTGTCTLAIICCDQLVIICALIHKQVNQEQFSDFAKKNFGLQFMAYLPWSIAFVCSNFYFSIFAQH